MRLTVTNVAGKNVKVTRAIVFIAAPSAFMAKAISLLKKERFLLTSLSRWEIMLDNCKFISQYYNTPSGCVKYNIPKSARWPDASRLRWTEQICP